MAMFKKAANKPELPVHEKVGPASVFVRVPFPDGKVDYEIELMGIIDRFRKPDGLIMPYERVIISQYRIDGRDKISLGPQVPFSAPLLRALLPALTQMLMDIEARSPESIKELAEEAALEPPPTPEPEVEEDEGPAEIAWDEPEEAQPEPPKRRKFK